MTTLTAPIGRFSPETREREGGDRSPHFLTRLCKHIPFPRSPRLPHCHKTTRIQTMGHTPSGGVASGPGLGPWASWAVVSMQTLNVSLRGCGNSMPELQLLPALSHPRTSPRVSPPPPRRLSSPAPWPARWPPRWTTSLRAPTACSTCLETSACEFRAS